MAPGIFVLTRSGGPRDNAHPSTAVWLAGLVLSLLLPSTAVARDALGVPLPKGVTAQGENRYQSPSDYPSTLKALERNLARKGLKVRFEPVIDLPEVIAAHAEAPSGKTAWSGINVSRYGGKTWIFVIRRDRLP